jgi:hypothetical protein
VCLGEGAALRQAHNISFAPEAAALLHSSVPSFKRALKGDFPWTSLTFREQGTSSAVLPEVCENPVSCNVVLVYYRPPGEVYGLKFGRGAKSTVRS